jgi:hypothetical protein
LYQKAFEFSRLLWPERIITSDDVMVEYLAFFAKAGPVFDRKPALDLP